MKGTGVTTASSLRTRRIASAALVFFVLHLVAIYGLQRSVLFPRAMVPPAEPRPLEPETIALRSQQVDTYGYLLAPIGHNFDRAPLMIYTHGNAERADNLLRRFDLPRERGWAVLLVEYPGYADAAGSPSQQSIRETMLLAYDWAQREPRVGPDRIVAIGRSLGGAAAVELATRRKVRALIVISSFTSVREMARQYLLPGFMIRDPFDSLTALRSYHGPVLVLHGNQDEVIPFEQGRELASAAAGAEFVELNTRHNNFALPWELILDFLRRRG